jgi:alkanesulfonate monooxygenase SsuD/methylene tetrahydromethanopterin reductase-like flavin-dependent oxidoreductase (luciferase family)
VTHVQFGLIVPETALNPARRDGYMEDLDHLLACVEGHFHSAWCIDHLQHDVLEGWTAASFLAARHPAFEWGHTVLSQPLRNPALLAKMAATLHFMADGRFVFGIGAGGQADEHRAYGYAFPRGRDRVAALDEALQIVKAMWTQERTTFAGKYHSVTEAICEPKRQPPPPVMVGAFGPQMLRLAARHADWWNVSSTGIEEYRRLAQEFERACAEVDRDPATVRRTWGGGCVCAPTEGEVAALAAGRLQLGPEAGYEPGVDFVGTPAQIVEQMQAFVAMGVDYFMLDCGGFPRLTTVEMLAHEVLPAIRRCGGDL